MEFQLKFPIPGIGAVSGWTTRFSGESKTGKSFNLVKLLKTIQLMENPLPIIVLTEAGQKKFEEDKMKNLLEEARMYTSISCILDEIETTLNTIKSKRDQVVNCKIPFLRILFDTN